VFQVLRTDSESSSPFGFLFGVTCCDLLTIMAVQEHQYRRCDQILSCNGISAVYGINCDHHQSRTIDLISIRRTMDGRIFISSRCCESELNLDQLSQYESLTPFVVLSGTVTKLRIIGVACNFVTQAHSKRRPRRSHSTMRMKKWNLSGSQLTV